MEISRATPSRHPVSFFLAVALCAFSATEAPLAASCDPSFGVAALAACEDELARNPASIDTRLRYADALLGQRKYEQAVSVLKEALSMQPGNNAVKRKYRIASSLADEQAAIDKLSSKTPTAETSSGVNTILCKTMKGERAIQACDEVLKKNPNDVGALTRRGDELVSVNRPEEAVASYRRALSLNSGDSELQRKLAEAEKELPETLPVAVSKQTTVVSKPTLRPVQPSVPKRQIPDAKSSSKTAESAPDKNKAIGVPRLSVAKTESPPQSRQSEQDTDTKIARRFNNAPFANGSSY